MDDHLFVQRMNVEINICKQFDYVKVKAEMIRQLNAAMCTEPQCNNTAEYISKDYQKLCCQPHLIIQIDDPHFTLIRDAGRIIDKELRVHAKVFAHLTIFLFYIKN